MSTEMRIIRKWFRLFLNDKLISVLTFCKVIKLNIENVNRKG